jgi:preprotein translocase subunit YajC
MQVSSGLLYDLCMLFFMGVVLLFIFYFKTVRPALREDTSEVTFAEEQ